MSWTRAAESLHDRVSAGVPDGVARDLTRLHAPQHEDGMPVCTGCDRATLLGGDPVWPCRTYTVIARRVLHLQDVEGYLNALRTDRVLDRERVVVDGGVSRRCRRGGPG